jgi:hypothetical protein
MRTSDANARGFAVENSSLTLDYNHVVNWSFAWDTSTVTGVTATGTTVSFRVTDASNNTSVATTAEPYRSQTAVNIVPYITGVEASLPSNFDRSADKGWYTVREGQAITIRGFNLANGATKPTVNVGATGVTGTTITGVVNISADRVTTPTSTRQLTVIVDNDTNNNNTNTVNSGVLTLVVNSITSLNNRNNNTAALMNGTVTVQQYNMEPNNVTNNTLNDDRGLYVWNTGYLVNSAIISAPIMRMSSNANRYTTFGTFFGAGGNYTNGQLKLIVNNDDLTTNGEPQGKEITNTDNGTPAPPAGNGNEMTGAMNGSVIWNTNRFTSTAVGVTPQGEWAVGGANQTSTGSSYVYVYNNWGQGRTSDDDRGSTPNTANTSYRRGPAKRYLVPLGVDSGRIRSPRIVMQRTAAATAPNATNPTRAVLAYYDNADVGGSNYPVVLNYGYMYGTSYIQTDPNFGRGTVGTAAGAQGSAVRVADNAQTKAKSGQYVAAGLLSDGRAVVAWFDATNRCLWYSYGQNAPGGTTATPSQTMANWQSNAIRIKDNAGTHVDMAVDRLNNIHLAYVDASSGGLWYTYISNATAPNTSPTTGNVKTVRVDTYLSTGQRLMINVREQGTGNFVPYITYIHNAFSETTNSVRVAWRNTTMANLADGTTENHTFTGAWEVMTVPAQYVPLTDQYVSNGVPTATGGWVAPVNSTLRTPTANGQEGGTNIIDRTILVGYMTDRWYEGAVLKHNIW